MKYHEQYSTRLQFSVAIKRQTGHYPVTVKEPLILSQFLERMVPCFPVAAVPKLDAAPRRNEAKPALLFAARIYAAWGKHIFKFRQSGFKSLIIVIQRRIDWTDRPLKATPSTMGDS